MQNKAKVKIGKMNINIALIKNYDKNNKQSTMNVIQNKPKQSQFQKPTKTSKEREPKRVSGTFVGSQLPERIYYCLWEIPF